MPTWRSYIKNSVTKIHRNELVKEQDFYESDFWKNWTNFLKSKDLELFLEKNNKKLIFYPHRNMQKYMMLKLVFLI